MRLIGLAALLSLIAPPAAARSGLPTGRAHMVSVSANPTAGLEAGMPRSGAYARGIDLDARMQWDKSYRAYREARTEFIAMLRKRPRWRETVKGWIAKADFQAEQSRRLRKRSYYSAWRWRSHARSAHNHYYQAAAKHNKWLAVRAFAGRAPRTLFESALKDYQAALRARTDYALARLALAALYHEVGDHDKGRAEFAKVRTPTPPWMAVNLAYYYAAAGKRERAVQLLERAVDYSSSNRRYILRSNDFDRLRSDPRFRKLAGTIDWIPD